MSRLDKEKQLELEPKRVEYAIEQITMLGYDIIFRDKTRIEFEFKGCVIKFYPYSGWASGRSINDCRGINNLLKQINKQ